MKKVKIVITEEVDENGETVLLDLSTNGVVPRTRVLGVLERVLSLAQADANARFLDVLQKDSKEAE